MPIPTVSYVRYQAAGRILRMLAYFESRRGPFWLHQLAERYSVSTRTVRRDLGFLVSLGAEIETSGMDTDDATDNRCRVFYRRPAVTEELPTLAAIARLGSLRQVNVGGHKSWGPRSWKVMPEAKPRPRVAAGSRQA